MELLGALWATARVMAFIWWHERADNHAERVARCMERTPSAPCVACGGGWRCTLRLAGDRALQGAHSFYWRVVRTHRRFVARFPRKVR